MAHALEVRNVTLPLDGFAQLEHEAVATGHNFLTRLRTDWQDKTNRFDRPGECLLGARVDEAIVAIGGLNRDPYAGDPRTGRLRHIYVLQVHRRLGIATRLVHELLARNTHFTTIRLRTPNAAASHFYETLGFNPICHASATHMLIAA